MDPVAAYPSVCRFTVARGPRCAFREPRRNFSPFPRPVARNATPGHSGCTMANVLSSPASFGAAVEALKNGRRASRQGWNVKGMWIELQRPDAHSKMSLPYVYMFTAQGDLVPWVASQTDILSEDWVIVP
jgi:hypothetical protein